MDHELHHSNVRLLQIPHKQYWGYIVVQDELENPIYFGKSKQSSDRKECDPFFSRDRALNFAKTLAGESYLVSEDYKADEFEHFWQDHGGG